MRKNKEAATVVTAEMVENWPDATKDGQLWYYGQGVLPEALAILRGKGYTPTSFLNMVGEDKIAAMIEATQNGVFSPDSAQTKLIDIHLRQIRGQKDEEEKHSREEVLDFLELLQSMASKAAPAWLGKDVVVTPTSVPEPKSEVDSLMGELF
jgi:hypothetical protein